MKINNLLTLSNFFFGSTELNFIETVTSEQKSSLPPYGQFSLFFEHGDSYWLVRDRLGLNKLFYNIDSKNQTLTFGNYFYDVVSATGDYNKVFSVPPGHALKIQKDGLNTSQIKYYDISETTVKTGFDLEHFQKEINNRLSDFFSDLNSRFSNSLFVICLSGGLDSTLMANHGAKHLKKVIAATFSYRGKTSEDFQAASSIAAALNLKFLPVLVDRKIEPSTLDSVLRYCQDWRDFNVHCAWVNYHLAEQVRATFQNEEIIFITGDLMNEYVADYAPVDYKGSTYYPQPKISKARLRKFFIYGLDTSDRELGVFHKFGIKTFQPYSILTEDYFSLPDEIFERDGCKEMLNLGLIEDVEVRKLVTKLKVRAQVGGKDGGTLGLFHDNKITQDVLQNRWGSLFKPMVGNIKLDPLFFSGRYRAG